MNLQDILTIEQMVLPIIFFALGGVAWGIRLEGKVNHNAKSIEESETRNGARLSRIESKIDSMAKDLNRMIGKHGSA